MSVVYRFLFPAMWLAWMAYWGLSARHLKATERKEPAVSRLLHVVPLALAVVLLLVPRVPVPLLNDPLFSWAPWQFWAAAIVVAAGLLFTVWARVHLGTNWSGFVTIKHGHELVMTGPYAIVRHPIYTGLLLAFVGSAMARGEWRGVIAVVLAGSALWRKLRFEERWMRERFGERYDAYARRVPALVPYWPKR